jgi:hypothetical protein
MQPGQQLPVSVGSSSLFWVTSPSSGQSSVLTFCDKDPSRSSDPVLGHLSQASSSCPSPRNRNTSSQVLSHLRPRVADSPSSKQLSPRFCETAPECMPESSSCCLTQIPQTGWLLTRHLFLSIRECEKLRWRPQQIWCLVRTHTCSQPPSSCVLIWPQGRSSVPSDKGTYPRLGAPPS